MDKLESCQCQSKDHKAQLTVALRAFFNFDTTDIRWKIYISGIIGTRMSFYHAHAYHKLLSSPSWCVDIHEAERIRLASRVSWKSRGGYR